MFQSGSTPIGNGASSKAVTFPNVFTATPDVIMAVVQNTVGPTAILLVANVTAASASGFTASFDAATDSTSYKLTWIAGTATDMLELLSVLDGRKLTSFDAATSMQQAFRIPFIVDAPVPHIELLSHALFNASVVRQATGVPAGPLDGTRDNLQIIADNNWLYVGLSSVWGRIPLESGATWSGQSFYLPFREGRAQITPVEGQLTYDIEFATAFTVAPLPEITVSLRNTGELVGTPLVADSDLEVLSYLITARSLTGFTIAFSSAPTMDNLVVYYMARQLPY